MTTFRYLTAGESHGPGLTVIVEGIPAGLELTEEYIEKQMSRRQKGYGSGGRMKIEKDHADIRSGVRHGITLGSPIAMWIENRDFVNWTEAMSVSEVGDDVDKKVYTKIVPGHADFAGALKYVQHDLRNVLERASARETAARVAAGSIARRLLEEIGISIHSRAVATGDQDGRSVATVDVDWNAVEGSEVRASDADADSRFKAAIDKSKKERTTIGGVFEVVAFGAPVGFGSHVHWDRKLDARLAHAMMSINAVKGVEIGDGFSAAGIPGHEAADEMRMDGDRPTFLSNHAGGILGGISTGQDLVVRFAVKPTSSILTPRRSIDRFGAEVEVVTKGRHDPCVGIRAVPVGEAMMACVLLDHLMRHEAQCGPLGSGQQ
ncbi:MAG: chorismate synthase [Chloroflexi bacterium]|nr:chorismate synthase [Chloroflexota bacterium]